MGTVDGRNPAPVDKSFTPLLIMSWYIPGGAGTLPSIGSYILGPYK